MVYPETINECFNIVRDAVIEYSKEQFVTVDEVLSDEHDNLHYALGRISAFLPLEIIEQGDKMPKYIILYKSESTGTGLIKAESEEQAKRISAGIIMLGQCQAEIIKPEIYMQIN